MVRTGISFAFALWLAAYASPRSGSVHYPYGDVVFRSVGKYTETYPWF